MGKFDHQFADLVITKDTTKDYEFTDLATSPTCKFRPATEDNKEFAAALLALSNRRAKSRSGKKGTTVKSIKSVRKQNRLLVARFCMVGWRGMKDTNGDDVEFTVANALEFLNALPHWLFDRLFAWLQTPDNFTNQDEDDEDENDFTTLEELDDLIEEDASEDQDDGQADEEETPSLGKPLEG